MDQQLASTLYTASTWVLPVLLAITLHEASHGFVAHRCGDDTAWRLGRVSFNPLKHIDPFGTILLPGLLLFLHSPFLFGYAKPVPVNFRALKHPRRDMVLVAAAGPGINIALAIAAALLARAVGFLPAGAQAMDAAQPRERHRHQRRAGGVQHDPAAAARRRPRRRRPAARRARPATGRGWNPTA